MYMYSMHMYIYMYNIYIHIYIYIYGNQVVGSQYIFFIFKELIKMKKSKPFLFDVLTCVFFKNIFLIHPSTTNKNIKSLHQLQIMIH